MSELPKNTARMWKIYSAMQKGRDVLLRPLVKVLAFLRVPPNALSYFGVLMMVLFAVFLQSNLLLALVFAAIGFLADLVDGGVARESGKNSDQGKFVDMVCDNLSFSIFVIGLVYAELLPGLTGLFLVYFMVLSKVFRSVRNALYFKTDWLFKAVAGFVPNFIVAIIYVLFVFYVITSYNFLWEGAMICTAVLVFDFFKYYYEISSYEKKR
ncbi:CDP-alcohol phosphatidyltransferase family protein [Candidatus Peregrinibacteria bacterium]|jgi:phosphatidylglycerophosphate synthase|nr:CDP-alcohol phosphatidyltransferase family protein [Candidatus Peregrinibacteria bacterium]MBT4148637.1 CDP-alcohol phosphatidyltransferase family protein [Candidatus Peregrinibacteria bacterium]MBT4366228.1 CDP-alcohol phosphatidyltransferase family protein [Candidatus Peregrinibacteria bacterium]MBT4456032.1 CDP-alcohol phosphatidyltransferase family protein [Candidatus Peregrinibacteria bacterium]